MGDKLKVLRDIFEINIFTRYIVISHTIQKANKVPEVHSTIHKVNIYCTIDGHHVDWKSLDKY